MYEIPSLRLGTLLTRLLAVATVDIAIWSTTEQGLAITAGSLATLRPLFRKVATQLGWSTTHSNGRATSGTPSSHFGFDRSRQNKKSRGPLSLATFTRHEPEDDESRGLEQGKVHLGNTYPGTFEVKVTASGKSAWTSKGRSTTTNDSDEDLRMDGAKDNTMAVKTKSFLITEERA